MATLTAWAFNTVDGAEQASSETAGLAVPRVDQDPGRCRRLLGRRKEEAKDPSAEQHDGSRRRSVARSGACSLA